MERPHRNTENLSCHVVIAFVSVIQSTLIRTSVPGHVLPGRCKWKVCQPVCYFYSIIQPVVPVAEILIKHSKLKKKLSSESSFQELPDVVVRTLDPESLGRCKQLNVGKIDHPSVGSLH